MSTFVFKRAQRTQIPLIIGVSGGTGSGKTYTALELATGLVQGTGKRIAVIDTEAGRAKHYAEDFDFDHGDMEPPFTPMAYEDAIVAADKAGYGAAVVDSASHEWAGTGGVLDWQEDEVERLSRGDPDKYEQVKMRAWIKPKVAHKEMVQKLLQLRCHLILCFRAEPKVEMVKDSKGKWQIQPKQTLTGLDGWVPICEKNLPFELTMSFLLMADKPGVGLPIKLEKQHRALLDLSKPLSRDAGVKLAGWAHGAPREPVAGSVNKRRVPETDTEWISAAQKCSNLEQHTRSLNACRNAYPDGLPLHVDAAFENRREWLIEQSGKDLHNG